jgi:DNA-binding Xre family transcriptional regulator
MEVNRIKVVLAEKKKTNRWLAAQLQKDESIVSKWCSNVLQPNLVTLMAIADSLEVDVRELIRYPQQKRV